MRKLLTGLTLILGILGACNVVEAATISVDAQLSHTDLSFSKPIDFTVRFPTAFTSIDLLTIDAFWIGDGLDGGEFIAYSALAGVGSFPGAETQFFRRLTFPASLGFDLTPFLDGAFDGTIYADTLNTTVTFDRLVFTVDGVPIPEPATLALLVAGLTVLGVAAYRRARIGQADEVIQ